MDLVARRRNIGGVSPALDAPGGVEVLAAAPRLRRRASPGQMTPMTRRHTHPIPPTDHKETYGSANCLDGSVSSRQSWVVYRDEAPMKQRTMMPNGTRGLFDAPISAANGNVPNAHWRPLIT
jgi:hypothetical protein